MTITENFLESEFQDFDLKLTAKPNGREGVDFLIGENQYEALPKRPRKTLAKTIGE